MRCCLKIPGWTLLSESTYFALTGTETERFRATGAIRTRPVPRYTLTRPSPEAAEPTSVAVVLGLILGLSQRIVYPMSLSYYLNLSIFLVLSVMFGDATVLLFFVVPVKMKWMAIVDVVLVLVDSVKLFRAGIWSAALVPLASIINFFIFTWPHWSAKLGRTRYRHDPKVVNFKKVQKQAQKVRQEAQNQGYTRKCAVCGVTDAMEPDMEFRYCSKCSGYHCYCINHINNHIHIQE